MKNNNIIRFVQSLVFLPMITTPFSLGDISKPASIPAQAVIAKANLVGKEGSGDAAEELAALAREARARAIDEYYAERDMPLAGMGEKMVAEAEKNDLDWRLVAAIAVRESTGGKNECKKVKNNPFGWGSCKIGFTSNEQAIEVIARNLAGKNPNTAKHYSDKTTREILQAYNPPSIVPKYADQVIAIMNAMGPEDLGANLAVANS